MSFINLLHSKTLIGELGLIAGVGGIAGVASTNPVLQQDSVNV